MDGDARSNAPHAARCTVRHIWPCTRSHTLDVCQRRWLGCSHGPARESSQRLVSHRWAQPPRARSHEGRFVGVRINEDEIPRLPTFPAQWALEDARKRPYLVIWGRGAYAIKMTPAEGGDAVVVTLTTGESYRIPILRRTLSRGGTALFYLCPWCRKPRRFLYLQTRSGDELVEYLGPRCQRCAGLRFASQGRYRTKLTREFSPILGPRPRYPWDPWAVSDPRIAERATQDRQPRGESPEVSDDPDAV
jgi:hypothetical protein